MFRCKECYHEFDTKPDYCDCGNNTFDEFQTPKLHRTADSRQIFSIIIFIICLILAIIPWTVKDKKPAQKPVVQKAHPAQTEIPDIETIWVTSPVKVEKPEPIPEPAPIKITEQPQIKTTPLTKKTEPPKKVQKTTQTAVQKSVQKTQTAKPAVKKESPQKAEPPKNVKTNTSAQQMQSVVRKPVPITKPVDKTPLINYKNELRVALLSKLNVPNIIGSGDCAVSFSIDENGKLLNRSFLYKSGNKSLNDEVYYMLMRLPYFKKPPEIYNGETFKIKFYINNGYYEISFI